MASLVQCVRSICCECTSEDNNNNENYNPPRSNRMERVLQSADPDDNGGVYSRAETEERDGTQAEQEDCCQNDDSRTPANSMEIAGSNSGTVSRWQFWRTLKERFSSLEVSAADSALNGHDDDIKKEILPILLQASSFDSTNDSMTIQSGQVVLPGSQLQQQMAAAMAGKLEDQDDECVICMEGFDPTNPRMPTLCGCGQNKTYFHLPCLYQWIEQSRNCPSCRKKLRWEEF